MKLLTKELEGKLPAYRSTENLADEERMVVCKFFTPLSNWTWYILEYAPKHRIFFALVDGFEKEFGDVSLDELLDMGWLVERDRFWKPISLAELKKELGML